MMNAISDAELLSIQAAAVRAACPDACEVSRPTRTSEPGGGAMIAYNTVETTVAGMSEPTAGQLANYGYLVGDLATWQVKLPVASVTQEKDRLTIKGQPLNVVKRLDPRSYQILLTCLCTEVK